MVEAVGRAAVVLERDEELLTADSALRASERGTCSVLILEGPAGIGKTSLMGGDRPPGAQSRDDVAAGHRG